MSGVIGPVFGGAVGGVVGGCLGGALSAGATNAFNGQDSTLGDVTSGCINNVGVGAGAGLAAGLYAKTLAK